MNILFIAGHCCIRAQKMALVLLERGHKVHVIANKIPSFYQHYFSFSLCNDISQTLEAIRVHLNSGQFDLVHVHNEPSYFVTMVKEIDEHIPVILDIHDSYLARSTPEEALAEYEKGRHGEHIRITTEERNNFQLADALVFPGDHFRQVVTSEFKLTQPTLTLPSYVPDRFYVYQSLDWHGGLVYEGKVNLPDETKRGGQTGFNYCEYTDLAQRAHAIKMDFHLYPARSDEKFMRHYQDIAFVHEAKPYEALMPAISRHDWGLVGNVTKTREWEVAMPNKLFEYMAAGVPVVSMNSASCSEFIEAHGVGITVSGPEELAARWGQHREIRKQVIKRRKQFSMNNQIHLLEKFYEEITT